MKYCYSYSAKMNLEESNKAIELESHTFTPRVGKLFMSGEVKKLKEIVVRFVFYVMTAGKAKIFYVSNGDELMHTSYVIPRCYKFSFINKRDYVIGPCFTYPKYRGKGIYPAMIRLICQSIGHDDTVFYMNVDETNVASIKGIEKAGFTRCGIVKVTRFTKRYLLERTI